MVGDLLSVRNGIYRRALVSVSPSVRSLHFVVIEQPVVVIPNPHRLRYRLPVRPLYGEASSVYVVFVMERLPCGSTNLRRPYSFPYFSLDLIYESFGNKVEVVVGDYHNVSRGGGHSGVPSVRYVCVFRERNENPSAFGRILGEVVQRASVVNDYHFVYSIEQPYGFKEHFAPVYRRYYERGFHTFFHR